MKKTAGALRRLATLPIPTEIHRRAAWLSLQSCEPDRHFGYGLPALKPLAHSEANTPRRLARAARLRPFERDGGHAGCSRLLYDNFLSNHRAPPLPYAPAEAAGVVPEHMAPADCSNGPWIVKGRAAAGVARKGWRPKAPEWQ